MAWIITGVLTVAAALSYGELAAMMPKAGGQYVYLRESYSPLWGFLYGWTLFLVIQTGTIAAVAVAFARLPGRARSVRLAASWIIAPIRISDKYAVSLSWQQFIGILLIVFLTILIRVACAWEVDSKCVHFGQDIALIGLILSGRVFGRNAAAYPGQFLRIWAIQGPQGRRQFHPAPAFYVPLFRQCLRLPAFSEFWSLSA